MQQSRENTEENQRISLTLRQSDLTERKKGVIENGLGFNDYDSRSRVKAAIDFRSSLPL